MEYEHRDRPLILVIFGITGDLAQRYQLPALYQLAKANELPTEFRIIGISRREVSADQVFEHLPTFVNEDDYDQNIERLLRTHTEMRQMNLDDAAAYEKLLSDLHELQTSFQAEASRLYYLSIPAQAFTQVVQLLGQTGHNGPLKEGQDTPRLLIEKPFGSDLSSARELVGVVKEHFSEDQIYRIDHYVAKEVFRSMVPVRFKNPLFENFWSAEYVDHIAIIAHEKIDIENRAGFYEQTGALRDVVQSHLLQLLALTIMDRPADTSSSALHTAKLQALRAIQPIAAEQVASQTLRGQYNGYRQDVKNPASTTETFARITLHLNNDRWRGVSCTLEHGKSLTKRRTEIRVSFKPNPQLGETANLLSFHAQPSEGISLWLNAKQPGIQDNTADVAMELDYTQAFQSRSSGAYEKVIIDAIRGDQSLFSSADEVIRSWEIIENVLTTWSETDDSLQFYEKGSSGPKD